MEANHTVNWAQQIKENDEVFDGARDQSMHSSVESETQIVTAVLKIKKKEYVFCS